MVLQDFETRSIPSIWKEYTDTPRQLSFQADSLSEAEIWQETLSKKLAQLLGGFPETGCDLDPQFVETVQDDGFRRDLLVIQTSIGVYMPVYVLLPDGAKPPFKPVIALHGYGTWGVNSIVLKTDESVQRDFIQQLNYSFARDLVKRGYLVFTPELREFGGRMEEPDLRAGDEPQWVSSCYSVGVNALLLGKTLLGMRVWDVKRLVDYISTRPEEMTCTLGYMGLSGGGMATLFATALIPRITCAIVSGYFNTFRDSIMPMQHCLCNYVPGILQFMEMVDIAGLITPRPLLIETGTQDDIFPVEATRRSFQELQQIFTVFDVLDRLEIDVFEGPHAWSGAKAFEWLKRWM
jgi:dienelactone hydrolase